MTINYRRDLFCAILVKSVLERRFSMPELQFKNTDRLFREFYSSKSSSLYYFSEGFSAIIHLHTAVEEVKISRLLGKFNRKTKKMEKFTGAKFLKQGDQGICRFKLDNMVAMDKVFRFYI